MKYIRKKGMECQIGFICTLLFQLCVISDAIIGSDPRLYLISKVIMLAFFVSITVKLLLAGEVEVGAGVIIPALYMALTILSCTWADNRGASFSRLGTQIQLYMLFAFVYLLFMNNETTIRQYLDALYIAGIGMAIFVLYRYGISGILQGLSEGERIGGRITNENSFGMLFSRASLIAFYYSIKADKYTTRIIHILIATLLTLFAFTSGSKKAFLMILFGILGISVLEYGITNIWKTIIVFAVVLSGILIIIRTPMFATMNRRITSFYTGNKDASERVRQHMIELSIELIKEKPLFGHGLRSFGVITGLGTYTHNNMTEVLVSTGIVGLVLFYLPYINILIWGWNKGIVKKNSSALLFLMLALLYLVFGYGMVECYSKAYWLFYGIMIALIDIDRRSILVTERCVV